MNRARQPSGRLRAWLALAGIVVVSAGPTAGDIGGCGQQAALLDDAKFFAQKARVDCDTCSACGIVSRRCELSCEGDTGEVFPVGCQPLVHDGEVCLRALSVADCDDYARYVADEGATTPTECAFCPLRSAAEAAR